MPWLRPTIKDLRARTLTDLNNGVSGPDMPLRRSSNLVLATAIAGASHCLYGRIEYLSKQINVITAEDVWLERHGRRYRIVRKPAAFAAGAIAVSGINGTVIPAETAWQGPSGAVYLSQADATIVDGVAQILVDATLSGPEANAAEGVALAVVSAIEGLQPAATVASGGIVGGSLVENDDSLRERILYRMRYPAMGGSQYDYVSWAREVPGVTRAWCFPRHAGPNTVGVAFVLDGQAEITPNAAKIAEVAAYIESHLDPVTGRTIGRPTSAIVTVFALTLAPLNPTIAITPDTADTRAEVTSQLEAFYRAKAAAGGLLYRSQIEQAISAAAGVDDRTLSDPITDVSYAPTELPVLGAITWA